MILDLPVYDIEDRITALQLLAGLDERSRYVVSRHVMDGAKLNEIAREIERNPTRVQHIYWKAIRKMRHRMWQSLLQVQRRGMPAEIQAIHDRVDAYARRQHEENVKERERRKLERERERALEAEIRQRVAGRHRAKVIARSWLREIQRCRHCRPAGFAFSMADAERLARADEAFNRNSDRAMNWVRAQI